MTIGIPLVTCLVFLIVVSINIFLKSSLSNEYLQEVEIDRNHRRLQQVRVQHNVHAYKINSGNNARVGGNAITRDQHPVVYSSPPNNNQHNHQNNNRHAQQHDAVAPPPNNNQNIKHHVKIHKSSESQDEFLQPLKIDPETIQSWFNFDFSNFPEIISKKGKVYYSVFGMY